MRQVAAMRQSLQATADRALGVPHAVSWRRYLWPIGNSLLCDALHSVVDTDMRNTVGAIQPATAVQSCLFAIQELAQTRSRTGLQAGWGKYRQRSRETPVYFDRGIEPHHQKQAEQNRGERRGEAE